MVRGSARSEETIKEDKLCGRERTIQVAKDVKKLLLIHILIF